MLAMEAIVTDEVEISERDIDRIEKAMRAGAEFTAVFRAWRPSAPLPTARASTWSSISQEARRSGALRRRRRSGRAAAVREIDLRKKFRLQRNELAAAVGLSPPKAKVLRTHLGIDDDPTCCHVFEFGAQKIPCFSDNAKRRMAEALPNVDMAELWANRNC
jgi:hypothetical protein